MPPYQLRTTIEVLPEAFRLDVLPQIGIGGSENPDVSARFLASGGMVSSFIRALQSNGRVCLMSERHAGSKS